MHFINITSIHNFHKFSFVTNHLLFNVSSHTFWLCPQTWITMLKMVINVIMTCKIALLIFSIYNGSTETGRPFTSLMSPKVYFPNFYCYWITARLLSSKRCHALVGQGGFPSYSHRSPRPPRRFNEAQSRRWRWHNNSSSICGKVDASNNNMELCAEGDV